MGLFKEYVDEFLDSYIFDGEIYYIDGKVWQVCDIIDLIFKEFIDNVVVRLILDFGSGWYYGGFWVKIKVIMKMKLVVIQFGRYLICRDFVVILNIGDMILV